MQQPIVALILAFCYLATNAYSTQDPCESAYTHGDHRVDEAISTLKDHRLTYRIFAVRLLFTLQHTPLVEAARALLDESQVTTNLSQSPEKLWGSLQNRHVNIWTQNIASAYGYERPSYHIMFDQGQSQEAYLFLLKDFLKKWDYALGYVHQDFLLIQTSIAQIEHLYNETNKTNLKIIAEQMELLETHDNRDWYIIARTSLLNTLGQLSVMASEEHEVAKVLEDFVESIQKAERPSSPQIYAQITSYAHKSRQLSAGVYDRIQLLIRKIRSRTFPQSR